MNIEAQGGTRSAIGGPLWDAVQSFVEAEEPGAVAAPICVAGFTDSHWMREAFGTIAYGFFPARDRQGNLIPNTYIVGMDYLGINYDYQDNLFLVSNIKAANGATPTPGNGHTARARGFVA